MREGRVLAKLGTAAAVVGAVGLLLGACGDDSPTYASDLADQDYDLAAMQLEDEDMPHEGMAMVLEDAFSNEEWAQLFVAQDPQLELEQKQIQIEAQGRGTGHLALFTWDEPARNLGKVLQVESHAILYADEESARDALRLRSCGLLIGDDEPLEPFDVPQVADESTGFFHESELGTLGKAVDTVVCFRTGRVVHAVLAHGLDGTQDIDGTLEMARRKLNHVDGAFENGES